MLAQKEARTMSEPRPGWVYVLTNTSMPGLVKVGLTSRNPWTRAAELTSATGVPSPFSIAWCRAVSDCAFVEATVHRMLDNRRVSAGREFFRCDVKMARQVIEAAAGAKLGRRFRAHGKSGAAGRKRRHGRRQERAVPAFLMLAGLCLVAVIVALKPALPAWVPGPVLETVA